MKMHLHTHELRHPGSPVFFLRALFLFSLFVSMVTVKLTPTVWGKYQNLNLKHCLSIQLQRVAVSGAHMIDLRKIPVTGGSLGAHYDSIHKAELLGILLC